MHPTLFMALRTLHLLSMALWVGGPVVAALGARKSLMTGGDVARDRVRWVVSVTPLFVVSALLTVGSGIGLILGLGGLSAVRRSVLVGAALAIAALPVGGVMNQPALMKLKAHFESGGSAGEAAPVITRFLLAHWIEQTLRFAALFLMAVPF